MLKFFRPKAASKADEPSQEKQPNRDSYGGVLSDASSGYSPAGAYDDEFRYRTVCCTGSYTALHMLMFALDDQLPIQESCIQWLDSCQITKPG